MQRRREDGTVRKSKGEFVITNGAAIIELQLLSEIDMAITKFRVEVLQSTSIMLTLTDVNGSVLYTNKRETGYTWTKVKFDLGNNITGVKKISLGIYSRTGILKIRNILVKACIQTGKYTY